MRAAVGWSFVRRPKWILSHLFAGSLIVAFVGAGFWQLDRLDQRRAQNEVIAARANVAPVSLADALQRPSDDLDYVAVLDRGVMIDAELIRVANRSQDGHGGDWVVGVFEATDGQRILVNRGFAPRNALAEPTVPGEIEIRGWLRASQQKDSFFGAVDTGEGVRAPRLDVEAIAGRGAGGEVAPVWLQLAAENVEGWPQPVPLPSIDEANHFSYALQWFAFAALGVVVYGLLLRKLAAGSAPTA